MSSNSEILQTNQNSFTNQNLNNQQYLTDLQNAILSTQNNQNSLTTQQILNNQNMYTQQTGAQNTAYLIGSQNTQTVQGTLVSNQDALYGLGNIQSVGGMINTGNTQNTQGIQTVQSIQGLQSSQESASLQGVLGAQSVQDLQALQAALQIQQMQQAQQTQNTQSSQMRINSQSSQSSSGATVSSIQSFQDSSNASQSATQAELLVSSSSLSVSSSSSSFPPSPFYQGKCTPYSCRYDCIPYMSGFYCALESQSGGISKNTATIIVVSVVCVVLFLLLIGLMIWKLCMRNVLSYKAVGGIVTGNRVKVAAAQGSMVGGSIYGGYGAGSRVMATGAFNGSGVYYQGRMANSGIANSGVYGTGVMSTGTINTDRINASAMLIGSGAVHGQSMVVQNGLEGISGNIIGSQNANIGAVGISNVRTRTLGVVNNGEVRGVGINGQAHFVGRTAVSHGQVVGPAQIVSEKVITGGAMIGEQAMGVSVNRAIAAQEAMTRTRFSNKGMIGQGVATTDQFLVQTPLVAEQVVYFDSSSDRRMLPHMNLSTNSRRM